MSRYRRVLTRIWEDDKFPTMPCESRLLFLYHLTSPRSTPFLLYVEGFGAIGDALRLPSARLRAASERLRESEMVWYGDDGSNLLFLPNALRLPENGPESRNAVTSWDRLLRDLPRTPFLGRCLELWARYVKDDAIAHPLTKVFLLGINGYFGTQEQEQEQEQELPPTPKTEYAPLVVWPESLREVKAFLEEKSVPSQMHDLPYWQRIDDWLGAENSGVAYLGELTNYLAWWEAQPRARKHKDLKAGFRRWLAKSAFWAEQKEMRRAAQAQARRR